MPYPRRSLQTLSTLFAALALAACGGGDDTTPVAPPVAAAPTPPAPTPPAPTPPPAVSTTVTGAVVKGPVSGAQVCAYTVVANGRGSALGSCTTSDASGNYSFAVPAGTGPLWVEATGGSYVDEATGATATLPAGSPLRSIITANAGTVNTMLTPLTTLALNAAAATVGSNGTLNAAAFQTAATQLLATFNLPATLNITGTTPSFGSGINSYGTALTVISQMVANGTTLASILATANPQALAAAYATAATPPAPAPAPTPVPPSGNGVITASGSVTGAADAFTPKGEDGSTATAFTTEIGAGQETYTFYNYLRKADATGTTAGVATQALTVNVLRQKSQQKVTLTEITYDRGIARSTTRFCATPCAGATVTPTASGSGVTLAFSAATFNYVGGTVVNPSTAPVVLNGSLTGEVPGGYAFLPQLPRSTAGSLTLAGVAAPVLYASVGYANATVAEPTRYPTVSITTAQGQLDAVIYTEDGTTPLYRANFTTEPDGERVGAVTSATALVETAAGYTVTLSGATLTGSGPKLKSLVVTAALTVGKTSGTVAIGGDGSFKAQTATLTGTSQTLVYDFKSPTNGPFAYEFITVKLKGGVVTLFTAGSATGKTYNCDNVGSLFMAKCAGTVTVSADQRTLTFSGFKAGLGLSPNATVSFDGSVTAGGL